MLETIFEIPLTILTILMFIFVGFGALFAFYLIIRVTSSGVFISYYKTKKQFEKEKTHETDKTNES